MLQEYCAFFKKASDVTLPKQTAWLRPLLWRDCRLDDPIRNACRIIPANGVRNVVDRTEAWRKIGNGKIGNLFLELVFPGRLSWPHSCGLYGALVGVLRFSVPTVIDVHHQQHKNDDG